MSVAKSEKIGLIDRIKKQYRGVVTELKKVHWPNKKEVVSYTTIVLVSVALVGAVIWIFDSGVSYLMNIIIE
ncbi:MAG: preprotein translocase subunit SecE [Peptococcaceae bacterium]|jgi:preprotein translocase subunit SecE|nr:preprotein translocase subunit SecE [Peptococcaceae bacterium]MDH7526492.1 preprotein translocase subunit SecE [Peptococcaceae bacterium]